jgi:hypothetical protein
VSGEEEEISARGKPITDSRRVMDVIVNLVPDVNMAI